MIVKVAKDFALLDRGEEEENRFIIIEDVEVDDEGHLTGGVNIGVILADEAVANGATRIPYSDCVDTSTGGAQSANDVISVYNGGDSYMADEEDAAVQFLLAEGLLERE